MRCASGTIALKVLIVVSLAVAACGSPSVGQSPSGTERPALPSPPNTTTQLLTVLDVGNSLAPVDFPVNPPGPPCFQDDPIEHFSSNVWVTFSNENGRIVAEHILNYSSISDAERVFDALRSGIACTYGAKEWGDQRLGDQFLGYTQSFAESEHAATLFWRHGAVTVMLYLLSPVPLNHDSVNTLAGTADERLLAHTVP